MTFAEVNTLWFEEYILSVWLLPCGKYVCFKRLFRRGTSVACNKLESANGCLLHDIEPIRALHDDGRRGRAFRVSGKWYFQCEQGGAPEHCSVNDFAIGLAHIGRMA